MTLETMLAVTHELKILGLDASLEFPGYIEITLDNGDTFHCGDANDTIACDLVGVDSEILGSLESDIPRDSGDVKRIAQFIAETCAAQLKFCAYCRQAITGEHTHDAEGFKLHLHCAKEVE